jgi:hypothetical protein
MTDTIMEVIAVARPDGGVSIARLPVSAPVACYDPDTAERMGFALVGERWARQITDTMIDAYLAKHAIPSVSWERVAEGDIPHEHREYRNAWALNGAAVHVDIQKARDVHRDRLRLERIPLLAALDVEFMRAIERGDATVQAEVAARKQALRDAPADARIKNAANAEALKALTLAELTR